MRYLVLANEPKKKAMSYRVTALRFSGHLRQEPGVAAVWRTINGYRQCK